MKLYIIRHGDTDYYKIGITGGKVKDRLGGLQCGNPIKLTCICTFKIDGKDQESELHVKFADYHVRGEWFEFKDIDKVISEIADYLGISVVKYKKSDELIQVKTISKSYAKPGFVPAGRNLQYESRKDDRIFYPDRVEYSDGRIEYFDNK